MPRKSDKPLLSQPRSTWPAVIRGKRVAAEKREREAAKLRADIAVYETALAAGQQADTRTGEPVYERVVRGTAA